jgi:membrane protease YdiL (CAAX protease family)
MNRTKTNHSLKGLFAHRSVGFQLSILCYLLLIGFAVNSILGYFLFSNAGILPDSAPDTNSARAFYVQQAFLFLSDLLVFIVPAIGVAYLCSHEPTRFLRLQKGIPLKTIGLTALLVITLLPVIDLAAYLNVRMQLPEWMAPIEQWMRGMEDSAAAMTDEMLSEPGVLPFLLNIFIVACMAGLSEEALFRGALTSVMAKKIRNPHITIWIVALVFSTFHLQFFGFVPRLLLGALMGYLLYRTNNIWAPVFAHFLNNAIAVVSYHTEWAENATGDSLLITDEMNVSDWWIMTALTVGGIALFVFFASKLKN